MLINLLKENNYKLINWMNTDLIFIKNNYQL